MTMALRHALSFGCAIVALALSAVLIAGSDTVAAPQQPQQQAETVADFGNTAASVEARRMANWAASADDHEGMPFVIVDKKNATLFVFDASARLQASTAVLLGQALGDDTVPDIGLKAVADVQPHERTTPAGRFIGERGHNTAGHDVVWVDYDAAVSMHRVVTNRPEERRLQRLASPSTEDNRISYGCINVPSAFYDAHIRPAFASQRAIIYVLPEQKSLQQVFGPLDRSPGRQAQLKGP